MTGQSETKHTPGELYAAEDFNGRPVVNGDGSVSIAACYHPPVGDGKANAARIVLTWNCHDELVAALEALTEFTERQTASWPDQPQSLRSARAALSRATSPTP